MFDMYLVGGIDAFIKAVDEALEPLDSTSDPEDDNRLLALLNNSDEFP